MNQESFSEINYDHLVICSGSNYNFPIKEQNIIIASRAEHLKQYYEKLLKAKNILIVGRGLVGVELAAEICTHYNDKKIILLHSREHLIQRNNIKSIKYVENFLKSEEPNRPRGSGYYDQIKELN